MLTIARVCRRAAISIYRTDNVPGIDEVLPKVTLHQPDVLVSQSWRGITLAWSLALTSNSVFCLNVDGR